MVNSCIDKDYALVGYCPKCNQMVFACIPKAVPDTARDITEMKGAGYRFEWVTHEFVRENFSTHDECEHP